MADDLDDLDDYLDDLHEQVLGKAPGETLEQSNETERPPSDLENTLHTMMSAADENPALKDLMGGLLKQIDTADEPFAKPQASSSNQSFADTVRSTTDRLAETSSRAKESDDMPTLDQLLREFGEIALDPNNASSDPAAGTSSEDKSIEGMLQSMIHEIVSKDILYEPIKELSKHYGPWLDENTSQLKPKDLERYQQQYEISQKICRLFEAPETNDGTTLEARTQISDLMNQFSQSGNPPAALLETFRTSGENDLDLNGITESLDESCKVQ